MALDYVTREKTKTRKIMVRYCGQWVPMTRELLDQVEKSGELKKIDHVKCEHIVTSWRV